MLRDNANPRLYPRKAQVCSETPGDKGSGSIDYKAWIFGQKETVGNNGRFELGGGRGIRTLDTVSRIHAFQACAFSRSATPPDRSRHYSGGRGRDNLVLRAAREPPGDVGGRATGRKDGGGQAAQPPAGDRPCRAVVPIPVEP